MSDPELEPLTDDLRDLSTREARAYAEDGALHARVRRGVELAIALRGGGGDGGGAVGGNGPLNERGNAGRAPGSPGTGTGRGAGATAAAVGAKKALIAVGLAGFVAGAGAGVVGARATIAPAASVVSVDPAPSAEDGTKPRDDRSGGRASTDAPADGAGVSEGSRVTAVATGVPTAPEIRPTRPDAASTQPPRRDLRREREMIDAARASLASGRVADALATLAQHERTFSAGQLTEERDALRIQALVAADRRAEAARYARHFHQAFPQSPLIPVVDAALDAR